MFEHFSPNLAKTVDFAREEANSLGHSALVSVHLLLGLTRLPDDNVAAALKTLGVTLPYAVREVAMIMGTGSAVDCSNDLPLDPQAQQLLQEAFAESKKRGMTKCRTEHLLIALSSLNSDEVIIKVLQALDVSIADIISEVLIMSPDSGLQDKEDLICQIRFWQLRFELARAQGNHDLLESFLEHKSSYERLLSDANSDSDSDA